MKVEEYEDRGYKVEIHTDDDPLNPRKEYDNIGTMCCEHRRYNLGDGGMDLLFDSLTDDLRYSQLDEPEDFPERDDYRALIDQAEKWGYVILPLYLYDHSGITMSTGPFSCPWDSGQVGIIFCSPQTAHKEGLVGVDEVTKVLEGEVETYDTYLTGDVYGYIVKDKDGEELDSCWGFFGDKYVKEDAKSIVDWYVKRDGEQMEMPL